MVTIELEEIEFYAHHGCFDEERTIGTRFTVSLTIKARVDRAVDSDKLQDTIDYQQIVEITASEMKRPSNLLEHVAGRIASALMNSFPAIEGIKVKVSKMNPPLCCHTNKVSVCIQQSREKP